MQVYIGNTYTDLKKVTFYVYIVSFLTFKAMQAI